MVKIENKDGKLHFYSDEDLSLAQYLDILLNASLFVMNSSLEHIMKTHEDASEEDAKAAVYDMFNEKATAVLELFSPETNRHGDITEEAILMAENNIVEYKALAESILRTELDRIFPQISDEYKEGFIHAYKLVTGNDAPCS